MGFDDQPNSAYSTPPLTTVRQPAIEMGRESARSLLALLDGEEISLPEFRAELVVRESVSRIR